MPAIPTIAPTLPQIKPAGLRTFHAGLATWYQAHGRHHLPWRQTQDPYAIWISEVMLQQTQVSTVLARFYAPFLETFPTVQSLATASREKVLKAWEGLGYYRRAGYLHEAAKRAHNGLPGDLVGLMSLPGIGRNTATAVMAFAHHAPVAIMEANVKRIVSRIFALEKPSEPQLWSGAEMLLDHAKPFDYNQAMMDVGSLICLPKKPDCPNCPANVICLGQTKPEAYPAPKVKKAVPVRQVNIEVMRDVEGKLFLEPRGEALLGGLYGFAQTPATPEDDATIGHVVHIYSHFRLEGRVMLRQLTTNESGEHWHTRDGISALPLSGVDHKILALVDKCHSGGKKRAKPAAKRAAR